MNRRFLERVLSKYLPDCEVNLKKLNIKNFELAVSINEIDKLHSYQRLEFLGDTVFHAVITIYLSERYPDSNDGFLSELRIQIESGKSMVEMCEKIGLNVLIMEDDDSLKEDIFEAFIGAFFLEFKFIKTLKFIENIIEDIKDFTELITTKDNYRGLLMRYFHKMKWGNPKYKYTIDDNKFTTIIKDPYDNILGEFKSKDKKKSEKMAARNSLILLEIIDENDKLLNEITDENKIETGNNTKKERLLPVENPNNKILKKNYLNKLFINYVVSFNHNTKFEQKYYTLAMTHRSYIKSKGIDKTINCEVYPKKKSNDRIMLLGNSILHLILSEFLFKKYPDKLEGFMTKIRARFENSELLATLSENIGLTEYILISQSIDVKHGRSNININSGCFEAFIGAIYLNYGYLTTYLFVISLYQTEINIVKIVENETNYKMLIQTFLYKKGYGLLEFVLVKEDGPMHKKDFYMGLIINEEIVTIGVGNSIKKAEQHACKRYYEEILKCNI